MMTKFIKLAVILAIIPVVVLADQVGVNFKLRPGTLADRPDAGRLTSGMIYYNSDSQAYQGTDGGGAWFDFPAAGSCPGGSFIRATNPGGVICDSPADAGPIVTSVTAKAPLFSSGGSTPDISATLATSTDAGLMSTTDHATLYSALQSTDAGWNYYVTVDGGSDSNSCLSWTSPCLTIQGAYNKLSYLVSHAIIINIDVGSYSGFTTAGHAPGSGSITFTGTLIDAPIDAGVVTGTSTASTKGSATARGTIVDTGSGAWTDGGLVGYLLEITSGAANGEFHIIQGNNADTITIADNFTGTPDATSGYKIHDWGSDITTASQINDFGSTTISKLKFLPATSTTTSVSVANSNFTATNNKFSGVSGAYSILLTSPSGSATIYNNYFMPTGSVAGIASQKSGTRYADIEGNLSLGDGPIIYTTAGRLYLYQNSIQLPAVPSNSAMRIATTGICIIRQNWVVSGHYNIYIDASNTDQYPETSGWGCAVSGGSYTNATIGSVATSRGGTIYMKDSVILTGAPKAIIMTAGGHATVTSGATVSSTSADISLDGTTYSYTDFTSLSPKFISDDFGSWIYQP